MATTTTDLTCLRGTDPDRPGRSGGPPLPAWSGPDRDAGTPTPFTVSTASAAPGEICVTAHGEIDLVTAPEFRARLMGALSHPSCTTVIVDLRDVGFMGVVSIRVLADASDHAAGRGVQMMVVATTRPVVRLFQVIGADSGVYSSIAAARAGVDLVVVPSTWRGGRG